jgi:hypothetical protein
MRLGVVLHDVPCYTVDLQRQLACWGDHDGAGAVARHELGAVQQLNAGDEEGQRLAGTCPTAPVEKKLSMQRQCTVKATANMLQPMPQPNMNMRACQL